MKLQALASMMFVGALLFVGAAKQDSTTTIKVVERAVNDTVTDLGPEGDSVGDILTFANEVYDEANAEKVGSDNGYCIRTVVGAAWECNWTITLADGQIVVEGPFPTPAIRCWRSRAGQKPMQARAGKCCCMPATPKVQSTTSPTCSARSRCKMITGHWD
jgi:hypothetical protein